MSATPDIAAAAGAAPLLGSAFPAGAVVLPDWGLIRARGEDATAFLQGQLTNDLASAQPGQARLAGYCSAKGRLLASFVAWRSAPDEWLLACSADVLPAVLKRLSMFVLRARCKLSDASAELALWGVAGAQPLETLGASAVLPWHTTPSGSATVLRLPDALGQPRALLVQASGAAAPAGVPALPEAAWRWLEVASGVARVVVPTVEAFVPQMVNLELVGGVSFKKGCYPGQEVVARSQYRGTLKRRAFLVACEAPLAEGQEVFEAADPGQPAGLVALAANWPDRPAGSGSSDRHLALVELKIAASAGNLRLGSAEGPALSLRALPYALPQEPA